MALPSKGLIVSGLLLVFGSLGASDRASAQVPLAAAVLAADGAADSALVLLGRTILQAAVGAVVDHGVHRYLDRMDASRQLEAAERWRSEPSYRNEVSSGPAYSPPQYQSSADTTRDDCAQQYTPPGVHIVGCPSARVASAPTPQLPKNWEVISSRQQASPQVGYVPPGIKIIDQPERRECWANGNAPNCDTVPVGWHVTRE